MKERFFKKKRKENNRTQKNAEYNANGACGQTWHQLPSRFKLGNGKHNAGYDRGESVLPYLEYMSADDVAKIASSAFDKGEDISIYLGYVAEEDIATDAKNGT